MSNEQIAIVIVVAVTLLRSMFKSARIATLNRALLDAKLESVDQKLKGNAAKIKKGEEELDK